MDERTLIVSAKLDELNTILDYVGGYLDCHGCPEEVRMSIVLAVEEMFVNIANYAYEDDTGGCEIELAMEADTKIRIIIRDGGRPFDPTAHPVPDIQVPLEERKIGGLGIQYVRNIMDSFEYRRERDHNIVTLRKEYG